METSRRSFIKLASTALSALGLIAATGSTLFLTACASVVNDLVTAFQAILNILTAAGLVPGGALVTAALAAVLSAVTAYMNAPAADKTSLGQDLSLAIQLAQARLQTWFTSLNLTGTLAIVVESLVSVILGTLAGFLPPLPVPVTSNAEIEHALKLPRQIVFKPVTTIHATKAGLKVASHQFRDSFNAALTTNGYAKTF